MRIQKSNAAFLSAVIMLAGCAGEEQNPAGNEPAIINQPLVCSSNPDQQDELLSPDYPGSLYLTHTGWEPTNEPALPATAYVDELSNQRDLREEQALDMELVELGLFYPSHTYRLSLEVKSATSAAPSNLDLSLRNILQDQFFTQPLIQLENVSDEWQTIEAEIEFQAATFPTLLIQTDGEVAYRNLRLENLSASDQEPYNYQQIVGDYIAQGWGTFRLNEIGDWTNETLGASVSTVEWTPYDSVSATCLQEAAYSTDYQLPALAPGHLYELTAYSESPTEEIKLVAYGSIQSKLEFSGSNAEPIFLRKEFAGVPTINSNNTQITFAVDSRHMTSLTFTLTSGDTPIKWNSLELKVVN